MTKLSLVYCQPNNDLESDENFKLEFKIYTLKVDLNLDIIPDLLLRARKILDQLEPPASHEKCKGICNWLNKVDSAKNY